MTPWFTHAELVELYPVYDKVTGSPADYVDDVVIPLHVAVVEAYTGWTWETPPDDVLLATRSPWLGTSSSTTRTKPSGARGQASFGVAGDQITLDRAVDALAGPLERAVLDGWRARSNPGVYHAPEPAP